MDALAMLGTNSSMQDLFARNVLSFFCSSTLFISPRHLEKDSWHMSPVEGQGARGREDGERDMTGVAGWEYDRS